MILLLLTFVLGVLPGVVAVYLGRGPRAPTVSIPTPVPPEAPPSEHPEGTRSRPSEMASLPAVAVLRDGAVGHTRWAFADACRTLGAVLTALAGRCTLEL